jgi:hypothetical protein
MQLMSQLTLISMHRSRLPSSHRLLQLLPPPQALATSPMMIASAPNLPAHRRSTVILLVGPPNMGAPAL